MTVTLSEDPIKILADQAWQRCQDSRMVTYIEVQNLTNYFLKMCREQNRDRREFDFPNLIDGKLNYYENRAILENELGGLESEAETKASNVLKDYLTKEQLSEYTPQERSVIDEVQQKNSNIEKRINKQEKQAMDIAEAVKEVREMTDLIMANVEKIPDIEKKIEALQQTPSFKDLGDALSPITIATKQEKTWPISKQVRAIPTEPPNTPPVSFSSDSKPKYCKHCGSQIEENAVKCWNCGAPVNKIGWLPECLIPKHKISLLDYFAGAITTILWMAITGWILTAYSLSFVLAAELAVFWLVFIVVFQLMVGGLLD